MSWGFQLIHWKNENLDYASALITYSIELQKYSLLLSTRSYRVIFFCYQLNIALQWEFPLEALELNEKVILFPTEQQHLEVHEVKAQMNLENEHRIDQCRMDLGLVY